MKNQRYRVKLMVIILLLFTFGWLQLTAAPAQKNARKHLLSIYASAFKHIPGLEKSEKKIIRSVIKALDLRAKKKMYHRGTIDVIDEDADREGDFLIVALLKRKSYDMDVVKITLADNYKFQYIDYGYKLQYGDSSTDWLPRSRTCDCPDETIEILLSTCETGIPTAVAGIEYSYDVAVAAGYNAKKLLGSEENTVDIDKWLCCPNLKYWGRIGHGYTGGIVLYDGNLTYQYFDSLPAGALQGKSLYFNSCQVFNDPLKSSILNKDAYKFIGGICNLYIGPSEEVFKCWNDHNFYQITPPTGAEDEMCYWSVDCESSTGYPELGCHGCGGPGLIFPEPGGINPPVADFSGNPTTLGAGGTVFFTDLSTNIPTAWDWTFDGGTPATSTEKNPEVIYNTVGTYTVSLTVTNSLGSDTETKVNYITVTIPQPPIADFSASSTSIYAGQSIDFTDQSANTPTSWDWTFAGGTPGTSTDRNPTITYNTPGTYTVTLTVANSAGSDTETKVNYIFVDIQPYCDSQGNIFTYEWIARVQVADLDNPSGASGYTDFTSLVATMEAGETVNVSLTPGFSGTVYTEYWKIWIDYNGDHDFEDAGEEVFSGVGSSTVSGSFTVQSGVDITTRMRVSMKYAGYPTPCETFTYGEVEDYTADIIPGIVQPPVADFTASATSVSEGESVTFTDLSTNNPDTWDWTFEGGTPGTSTLQNPVITYNTSGTYTVTLTVTNSAGSDTETKVDYINVSGSCSGTITNPGFETGSTFGWTAVGDVSITTDSHSGSYAVSLDGANSAVEQVITGLCVNTTYTVSCWGQARDKALVYLGVKNYGGTEQTVQFTDFKNYVQKSITFTTGPSNTSVTIFFSKTDKRFTGLADDFEIVLQ